ncbi:anti-virulence regulator CigR family protein [Chitinibacteraceae bacterium HSL-7]
MMKRTALLLTTLALIASPLLHAKPHGGGHGKHDSADSSATVLVRAGITVTAARSIASDLKLTGYDSLPPGIRKNLARGKPLPPGIAKKMAPQPLISRLPVHVGYEWKICGSDLVLVALGTAIVADVLSDVFR